MNNFLKVLFFCFFFAICGTNPAFSQIFADEYDGSSTLSGSVGIGAGYVPKFIGSDAGTYHFFPYFKLNYGPFFANSDKGLGVRFQLVSGRFEIAPAINFREGRYDGASSALTGMGDVNPTITAGATITYYLDDLFLGLKAFQGLNKAGGLEVDLRAGYVNRFNDKLHWGIMASTSFADDKYNQNFFGITEEQATASGVYAVYSPEWGFKDVGITGSVDYYISEKLSIDLFAKYRHLLGEAGASPIVRAGTPEQFQGGLVLFYHFGTTYY
jgi:outer membrane protein